MREVHIDPIPLERLGDLLRGERRERMNSNAALARQILDERVVWSVNATASGGGVAEMLTALLAYARGAGVDARWLVLDGNPEFFRITKRIHNMLHGVPGDGGDLGEAERAVYDETLLSGNLSHLTDRLDEGDIVLLHDPQTAGLIGPLQDWGVHVIWRSHVGRDTSNEWTDLAWRFLRPYVEQAEATIFSRDAYMPSWIDPATMEIIPPSLDPFSTKNIELSPASVHATLRRAGLVAMPENGGSLAFTRRDGSSGTVREHHGLFVAGGVIPGRARLMMQVSRWDRLKDMSGILTAFVQHLAKLPEDVHLALVGPDSYGVSDDPEGAEVLDECVAQWNSLPDEVRERVHLAALPMDDVDENAHLVNALQRHASLVVQKSLVEGFGLTVTEPMWKGKPVVASRVGGIQDQITDGESGLLVDDPADLEEFADDCARILNDPLYAEQLGATARERVRDRFLGDRHLIQYVELFHRLLETE